MTVDVLEFGVLVIGGGIIVSVVYEITAILLRRQDNNTRYDGRTKR